LKAKDQHIVARLALEPTMTIALDISSELEERLRRAAQLEGLTVEKYILALAERASTSRRPLRGYGRFAHVSATVEDLHRERQEDAFGEDRA